jgi:hypothetical protein
LEPASLFFFFFWSSPPPSISHPVTLLALGAPFLSRAYRCVPAGVAAAEPATSFALASCASSLLAPPSCWRLSSPHHHSSGLSPDLPSLLSALLLFR